MDAVPLATGELTDPLLLVGIFEVEARDVTAALRLVGADLDRVEPVRDLLPDGLLRVERIAALVDVGELHGLPELERARVGLLLAHQDPEQRRLARAVGADHADDAARREAEGESVEEQLVAVGLPQPL